jgi:hypothetical protein
MTRIEFNLNLELSIFGTFRLDDEQKKILKSRMFKTTRPGAKLTSPFADCRSYFGCGGGSLGVARCRHCRHKSDVPLGQMRAKDRDAEWVSTSLCVQCNAPLAAHQRHVENMRSSWWYRLTHS